MDFLAIRCKESKEEKGTYDIFPDFLVKRTKDLMVRGRSFYAVWDTEAKLWSTDEYRVQNMVDAALDEYAKTVDGVPSIKKLSSFNTNGWAKFKRYLQNLGDAYHILDDKLTFANQEVKQNDFVSRRLPYALEAGDYSAWDELIGTLYSVDERAKIEWAIGAVVAGDAKKIQKFLVLYGSAGTGKSTVLNIIEQLFEGYTATFEAKALGQGGSDFATEAFKNNPLVAIQHDGDLSRISDNTKLNSIIAHEQMTMNEKYKPSYTSRVNAFLFMGTNQPVKITDAKSGLIRRLIDVHPTGVKFPPNHYQVLIDRIGFESGAIAHHCLEVYRSMGKNYYNSYIPITMMYQTDTFFNFVEAVYDVFKSQQGVTLKQAYDLYKEYCTESGIEKPLQRHQVREELKSYFKEFHERYTLDGSAVRSYFLGFTAHQFREQSNTDEAAFSLVLEETKSIFDELAADYSAQGHDEAENRPQHRWENVTTTLKDLDTTELHYVKVPENHIVIDFDLTDCNGTKALERNLEAASGWPATYGELSKSGAGVHLHYLYEGDATMLKSVYSEGIEVKVFTGNASLRRKLTRCNNVPVTTISSGLPVKEKKVLSATTLQSEKGLRDLIARNLRKEVHPGTKPSIDFIVKILDDAYESGMVYNVLDLRARIVGFANNSTNQPLQCLKAVQRMKFESEAKGEEPASDKLDIPMVFFDVEVYPNLFVVCWKYEGSPTVVKMLNPSAQDVEGLFKYKLVGFNNRRYDNHILWGRYMGCNNQQLYELSQKIINNDRAGMFGEAYDVSYTDIYDFSSKKQGLKKFEIELGLPHVEMDIPWDEPVPPELWDKVMDYCANDVLATEATFQARKSDFTARQILAELSGMSVNTPNNTHSARIIFGNNKAPQSEFNYVDLSKMFPGYVYDCGKSTYRDEHVGEGGYVYAEPGIYSDVALLDVASMHPASLENMNLFGMFTKNFSDMKTARVAIKRKEYDAARKMLGGKLSPYLTDDSAAKELSYALKIVINSVYGLTSAKFPNPFRDNRNKDNIVAKRGALFMIDLKHAVQEQGFTVAHIKTDSIKIPNATQEIIDFVFAFGEKYGYEFEHEATYKKFCLVNDAVYIAHDGEKWAATGAQFQNPYVFKKLFTDEPIEFDDLCFTKSVVKGAMYLDFEYDRPEALKGKMHFVGRTGRFVPVEEGQDGATLWRIDNEKLYAVAGTKGYLWMEATVAKEIPDLKIDMSYFDHLKYEAENTIGKFGSLAELLEV